MLRELISALLSKASPEARRLGYVHEGIAIAARHRRHAAAWDGHLRQCRQAIMDWVDRAAIVRGTAGLRLAVLGSGGLLDVPLDDLAGRGLAIDLVDVFHPRSARRQASRYPGVTLIEHDFLGLRRPADLADAAPRLTEWRRLLSAPPDLVVSCNLLSQLPLRPLDVWGAHVADPLAWARAVMQAHLQDLRDGPGAALLLSEYRHRWIDRAGRVVEEADPLNGLASGVGAHLPAAVQSWDWVLAPYGEIERDQSLVLSVGAFELR